ncbi:MAG TPA: ROK family protein [Candidatus Limiplasma sp.]|nr:ROK family protein [Candidatus Limiplasma sp.]HRX08406.1 ROK family protein [Candidatus Limiplasma sp.]
MHRIGALEAGGTKMVLGVFDEQGNELKRDTFPTLSPEETVPKMLKFLSDNPVDALGIASFGPVDLHAGSETYGSITTTPKTKWKHYNLLRALTGDSDIPCAFDTDVNAAALAEAQLGAAKGMTDAVYVTIGTGIGAGVLSGGKLVHGLLHPELGHMLLRPHPEDPNPRGVCPYHDGCLEGLAAGPAIGARINGDARTLPDDHPTFALEAYYLAQMCMNIIVTLSPQRIILGGGVMERKSLFPMIGKQTQALLNGYVQSPAILEHIDEYIVPPSLFPVSGLVGAYLLGKQALLDRQ